MNSEERDACAKLGDVKQFKVNPAFAAAYGGPVIVPDSEYAAQLRPGRYVVCLGAVSHYSVWEWCGDRWLNEMGCVAHFYRGQGWCDGFLARIDEIISMRKEIERLTNMLGVTADENGDARRAARTVLLEVRETLANRIDATLERLK